MHVLHCCKSVYLSSVDCKIQEGIEAIHLYTGRTICKLHLPKDGLHADVNGDGVLDHAMAYGGNPQRNAHADTGAMLL